MRCVVVGAGAWGLPAAAELAARGHDVTLVDRHGVANALSSSHGPTRIWRLTHPDAVRVRLALRSVEAMQRLADRSGRTVFLRRGLLWRDSAAGIGDIARALSSEHVEHQVVDAWDVGRLFPGLVPSERAGVWVDEAGPVLAAASLQAQAMLFERDGGRLVVGREVAAVNTRPAGVRLEFVDGGPHLDAEVVVLAAGTGSGRLLTGLGIDLGLTPRLEQVVHLGSAADPAAADHLPCLIEGDDDGALGVYAMPTPGVGYKVGIDGHRRFVDDDRTPDPDLVAVVVDWARRTLPSITPEVRDAQVCSWTDSPDKSFVIDTLPGGVVLACGDSGQGFKFSALMGLVLADLAEGKPADPDVATFSLARYAT